ncbi:zinc ribbon domain-containing protein [Halobacillus yeomjeoni]|uniref:zinc ribbon domain-containing protein n=1 Tax=Halobacillus yeomjeoni TaxID=311194 RepID=UPI001CD400A8|nr:zinc ribbon domain-containing protein [Halobacillus yeomjeoni]MCA0985149.1 zinc ribbon domain-containing protein [Halobacillus yeomjeoni]
MNCSKCGTEIVNEAKFCGGCGAAVVSNEANGEQLEMFEMNQQQPQQQRASKAVPQGKKDSEYVEKAKVTSRLYLNFATGSLKAPFKASQNVNGSEKVNGVISMVLLAFFIPLFSYLAARSFSYGVVDVSFGTVFQPFFYLLIFLTVFITVTFGVAKLMRVDVSFMDVLAKYGSLAVLPVVFLAAACLFSILSMDTLSAFVFFVGIVLGSVASSLLLFSVHSGKTTEGGLDLFYGILVLNVLLSIIFFVAGVNFIEGIVEQIGSNMLWFY